MPARHSQELWALVFESLTRDTLDEPGGVRGPSVVVAGRALGMGFWHSSRAAEAAPPLAAFTRLGPTGGYPSSEEKEKQQLLFLRALTIAVCAPSCRPAARGPGLPRHAAHHAGPGAGGAGGGGAAESHVVDGGGAGAVVGVGGQKGGGQS